MPHSLKATTSAHLSYITAPSTSQNVGSSSRRALASVCVTIGVLSSTIIDSPWSYGPRGQTLPTSALMRINVRAV
ncbi:hypothetical protein [Corynebacterium parakroppenstedtii]|uniref:hypothetical protein n=1 Tax=Corynebacterium parakroppenstedtii TaxID=2828363 RepID=UPI001C8E2B71|nr:hypothetical protein [Corynebacterium parakroppenstedtii]MBY0788422.1 hypothetical protein [Corynebacterium parakroppenstedtii]